MSLLLLDADPGAGCVSQIAPAAFLVRTSVTLHGKVMYGSWALSDPENLLCDLETGTTSRT